MRFYITAFPIDKEYQKVLEIYESGYVLTNAVGRTVQSLLRHGYTKCNSFVEEDNGASRFVMHFTKEI